MGAVRLRAVSIQSYNEGLSKAKEGNLDEAEHLLTRSIREDPSHVNAYNVLGKVLIQKGDPQRARACWEAALRLDPLNETAWDCIRALGEPRRLLRRIGFLLPSSVAAILLLWIALANRSIDGRIEGLERSLSYIQGPMQSTEKPQELPRSENPPPDIPEISPTEISKKLNSQRIEEIYGQALAQYYERRYAEAILGFQQVLDYKPFHPLQDNAQYWIGECYYGLGEYERALSAFERAETLFPEGNKRLHAWVMRAASYDMMGEPRKALEILRACLREDLGDSDGRKVIAMVLRIESELSSVGR